MEEVVASVVVLEEDNIVVLIICKMEEVWIKFLPF